MSVEFTDEQYGVVARALVAIAAGKRVNDSGKLVRVRKDELINRAREAAAAINLHYLGDGSHNPSFPDEIGFNHLMKSE